MKRPTVAITMGDPAGVGPELSLRAFTNQEVQRVCQPILFGDSRVIRKVAQRLELLVPPMIKLDRLEEIAETGGLVDCSSQELSGIVPGLIDASTGAASFKFIEKAIAAALESKVDAVVTCPIHKEAWKLAGIRYPGHTELFAERAGTDDFCMMMTAPAFSCSLVTTHVGYWEVPDLITADEIVRVGRLTRSALRLIHGREPKLMVLGLNPHAGEGGLFGRGEEESLIAPAVKAMAHEGMQVEGPVPPDTAFLESKRGVVDGYVCMYHDQGLIPFKALNFDTGVNITLGMPNLIRTSVDHGTALDIAWQGIADSSSLIAAVRLAAKLANGA